MRNASVLLIAASLLACRPVRDGGDEPYEPPVAEPGPLQGNGNTTADKFLGHAGALRAGAGLRCGSESICSVGRPALGDRCASESEIWSATFTQTFDACAAEPSEVGVCFEEALAAHVPSEAQELQAAQCRDELARCPTLRTDACQALEALEDPDIVQSVLACTDRTCGEASLCLATALLIDHPPPAACETTSRSARAL